MRGHRVSALVNRTRQETFDSEEQEGTVSRQDEGEGTKRELRADATRSGPGSPARPRPPTPPSRHGASMMKKRGRLALATASHREEPLAPCRMRGRWGGRGAGPRSELPRETRMVSSFPLLSGRLREDWRPRPRLSPRRDEDTARESPVWTRSRRGSRPAVSLPRR